MTDRPSVLVPLRVLDGESLPDGVPEFLADTHVVLLGYHVVPEQTPPGQARLQFEERATARLDEFEASLTAAGATVDRRLVFTGDGQQTLDRTIEEHDCLAVLVPSATGPVEDVLVAVRGTVGVDRLARVVAGVFGETDAGITLYHVADANETDADAEVLLDTVTGRLTALGVDDARVSTRVERDRDPIDAIADATAEFDTVVMGETDPSLSTFVFGMPADQIAERFLGPVLVVQRESEEVTGPELGADAQSGDGVGDETAE